MKSFPYSLVLVISLALCAGCMTTPAGAAEDPEFILLAQADLSSDRDEREKLKLAALEGLMSAPPERALPLVKKVLQGNHSREVKSRALFVLSQIDGAEAETILNDMATDVNEPLRHDAIRMIGIGGNRESLARLTDIYRSADEETRSSVLNAWLIADDAAAVYQVAREAGSGEDFNRAVQTLATMGAVSELRCLADEGSSYEGLTQALAVAGDLEGLRQIVDRSTDPEERRGAVRAMGIVGGNDARTALVELYRDASDDESRDAAMQGLLISGADEEVLGLFRASTDAEEKRKLLRLLMVMGSDVALEVIDSALAEDES